MEGLEYVLRGLHTVTSVATAVQVFMTAALVTMVVVGAPTLPVCSVAILLGFIAGVAAVGNVVMLRFEVWRSVHEGRDDLPW